MNTIFFETVSDILIWLALLINAIGVIFLNADALFFAKLCFYVAGIRIGILVIGLIFEFNKRTKL